MAPRGTSHSTQQLSTPGNGDYARNSNNNKEKVRFNADAQELEEVEGIERKTRETSAAVTPTSTSHAASSPPAALDPYSPSTTTTLNNLSSMMGMYGGAGMGMYGGAGMMGMYGGGAYGGGMGMLMPPMGGGALSSLNQFLFGVQNVIFSLSQAVQIIGMNTHALQNLLEAATAMFDHAVATWHEMQVMDAEARELESEEQKKRRRRLRALRWAMLTAATYAGYRLIRRVFFYHHHRQQYSQQRGRHPQRLLEGSPPSSSSYYSPNYSYPGSNVYNPYGGSSSYYGY